MMQKPRVSQLSNMIVPSLLAIATIGISACNTAKKIATISNEKPVQPVVQKPEVYLKHRLLYKTFSGRSDAQVHMENKDQKVNLRVTMHKDQDLMVSAIAMGMLEVGRAYVTPDSVFALNRLNKTGYAMGYKEGTKILKADIPFGSLQDLLVGNPLLPVEAPVTGTSVQDSMITITQKKDSFVQVLQYDVRTQALKNLELKATNRSFECKVQYDDYRKIGIGQSFAYDRQIKIINNGKKINLNIQFTQADINRPVNTNFRIPPSYDLIKQVK